MIYFVFMKHNSSMVVRRSCNAFICLPKAYIPPELEPILIGNANIIKDLSDIRKYKMFVILFL